jgi:hypothetical protein
LSGTKKDCTVPSIWIKKYLKNPERVKKELRHQWIISFRYLDEQDGFFAFRIGYNDEVLEVIKNY